jgi:hypothetical protein
MPDQGATSQGLNSVSSGLGTVSNLSTQESNTSNATSGANLTGASTFGNTLTGLTTQGNLDLNVLDPGAIAAGQAIAISGITADKSAFQEANDTIQKALLENTAMAQQTQQGQIITGLKAVGVIGLIAFGLWVIFGGGRNRKAATA